MKWLWLGRWSLLAAMLLCIMQGTWQKEAEEPLPSANNKKIARYFKTDTDTEVILILSKLLELTNPCVYDVTIVMSENADELALYWNRTAILLKHSSLMNYTSEYTVELTVFYRPNCDSSVGSENVKPVNVTVKLRPLDIHLVSPGEIVEGEPLKLTCTVFGHTPTDNDKVKIHYWISGEPIANCSSDTIEVPNSDVDYSVLTSTCELSAHSTQSNSGDYSCSASVEDMMVSSRSEDVYIVLNDEPRIDWKTIFGVALGSSAGLIVLAFLAIVISVKRHRSRKNPPGIHDGLEENAHLLDNGNADIGDNVIMPGFNQYHGVDDHRKIEANLGQGQRGRSSPANSDKSSKPGDHNSLVLSDQGGYESNV